MSIKTGSILKNKSQAEDASQEQRIQEFGSENYDKHLRNFDEVFQAVSQGGKGFIHQTLKEPDIPARPRSPSCLNPSNSMSTEERIKSFHEFYAGQSEEIPDARRLSFDRVRVRRIDKTEPPQYSRVSSNEQDVMAEKETLIRNIGGTAADKCLQVAKENRKKKLSDKDRETIQSILGILVHGIVTARYFDTPPKNGEEIMQAICALFDFIRESMQEMYENWKAHNEAMLREEQLEQSRKYHSLRGGGRGFGYPETCEERGQESMEPEMLRLSFIRPTAYAVYPGSNRNFFSYYSHEVELDIEYLLRVLQFMSQQKILTNNERTKQNLINKFHEKTESLIQNQRQMRPKTQSMFPLMYLR